MKKIQVYDPPMCCSSAICGPNVDPTLVRFNADFHWLANQGVAIERYNLGHRRCRSEAKPNWGNPHSGPNRRREFPDVPVSSTALFRAGNGDDRFGSRSGLSRSAVSPVLGPAPDSATASIASPRITAALRLRRAPFRPVEMCRMASNPVYLSGKHIKFAPLRIDALVRFI